jgi:4-carboxymuconolactone decarboxylase
MKTQEYEKERGLCARLHRKHNGGALVAMLEEICPDYLEMTMESICARITASQGLSIETRVLLLLACCICRRELPLQVKAYVEAAHGLGISRATIAETLLQTLPIAGLSAVTDAFLSAKEALSMADS